MRNGGGDDGARVTLVGRVGCHLCDDARGVLERLATQEGVRWEEIDLDEHPEMPARFSELVPVVLVDGRQVCFWRIDETKVRAAIRGTHHVMAERQKSVTDGEDLTVRRGWLARLARRH